MKNLLVLAALTVAVSPAFASKARYGALGHSYHITDTQSIFVNPVHMHKVGQFATFELGQPSSSAAAEKAEGGFLMNSSWGVWGAYIGHRSETVTEFVSGINASTAANPLLPGFNGQLLTEQNPVDLFLGGDVSGMKWGTYIHYSSAKNDAAVGGLNGTDAKVETAGAGFGLAGDLWDAYLRVGLNGKSEAKATAPGALSAELKQKGLYSVGGGYWMENNYVFANFLTAKGEFSLTGGGTTDIEKTEYQVGVVNNNPVAGGNVFYGVSYLNNETKNGNVKATKSRLPVVIGMEVDAASWLVLRGSLTQAVLVGENKAPTAAAEKSELVNSTTVAAGAGIKFGKLTLDGLISHTAGPNAGRGTEANLPDSNGTISGTGTFTQASLTYLFQLLEKQAKKLKTHAVSVGFLFCGCLNKLYRRLILRFFSDIYGGLAILIFQR